LVNLACFLGHHGVLDSHQGAKTDEELI
jgi:hypothetical protein